MQRNVTVPPNTDDEEGGEENQSLWEELGLPEPPFLDKSRAPPVDRELIRQMVRCELPEKRATESVSLSSFSRVGAMRTRKLCARSCSGDARTAEGPVRRHLTWSFKYTANFRLKNLAAFRREPATCFSLKPSVSAVCAP